MKNEGSRCFFIDDILSLNNSKFGNFVDHIYPIELEISDITDASWSAPYLNIHFDIYTEGRLRITILKRKVFNFPIWNFPFICSNIPIAPLHEAYRYI